MEGVDVADELPDGVVDATAHRCAKEEEEQESIQEEQGLPVPQMQGPVAPN